MYQVSSSKYVCELVPSQFRRFCLFMYLFIQKWAPSLKMFFRWKLSPYRNPYRCLDAFAFSFWNVEFCVSAYPNDNAKFSKFWSVKGQAFMGDAKSAASDSPAHSPDSSTVGLLNLWLWIFSFQCEYTSRLNDFGNCKMSKVRGTLLWTEYPCSENNFILCWLQYPFMADWQLNWQIKLN